MKPRHRMETIGLDQPDPKNAVTEGSCATWHAMPEADRDRALLFIRENQLLTEPRAYLLGWMLRSQQLGIAEELQINEMIEEARKKLMANVREAEIRRKNNIAQKPQPAPAPVKPRRVEDIVPQREAMERFLARGINLEDLRKHWQSFYYVNGYAATLGPHYEMQMPSLTEGAMNRFERALETKEIDSVMIDDPSLGDGLTFRLLQPATPAYQTRLFQHTRHLGPKSLAVLMNSSYLLRQKIALEQDPVARKRLVRKIGRRELGLTQKGFFNDYETNKKVRLIGLRINHEMIVEPGPDAELERGIDHLGTPYSTMMNMGTFLRLAHFLRTENPLALYRMTSGFNGSGELTDPYFFMNNFLTDGQITVARHAMSQSGAIIETENRETFFAGTEDMSYIPVIQSDLPAPVSDKKIIYRRMEIESAA